LERGSNAFAAPLVPEYEHLAATDVSTFLDYGEDCPDFRLKMLKVEAEVCVCARLRALRDFLASNVINIIAPDIPRLGP
jgi:hypothetical protein